MINHKANNPDYASKFMEFWLTDCMGLWSDASFQPGITGAKTRKYSAVALSSVRIKRQVILLVTVILCSFHFSIYISISHRFDCFCSIHRYGRNSIWC